MFQLSAKDRYSLQLALSASLVLAPLSGWAQSTGTPTTTNPPAVTQAPVQSPPSQPTPSQTPSQPAPAPSAGGNTSATPDSTGPLPPPTVTPSAAPGTAPPAPPTDGKMPGVKPGSVDDVSAVGNRDIGARGMGNWYSTESEIKMGKSYSMEIEKSTKFITDPVITEYVNRIGQNIVKNSDCKVPFTIKVIDSDEVNAMALPGGFFYVNSGLILAADEEAELAGVMAHETAHVCAHHAAREQTRANYAQIGSMASMILIPGWAGYGIYEASGLAIPLTFLQFSREFEAQADYLGVQYMYRTGYDPQAFVTFFEKIQNLEKRKPGAVARAFSSHPQTPDRIEHSQQEIARILPPRDEYVVTTSEFDDVKARLARIENKRRLNDKSNGAKPTLRRASTTVGDPSTQGNNPNSASTTSTTDGQGDDQPTLHRRDN
ncbi:peptidase M48, Ste24p [Acidisarcina polymorpha]|uniref:Peptidase M48, Ste24p n=1 Tax=Acidisarcina polymorpha TaxID=2211140 RepID=A0A2Z5G8X5_9BACT|nr:M48 family metallopeptidase [Acidisarcina polymorpha]AXC15105.1 peptidase M48, Ste24p [Acidisarcina polymorpha]